MLVQEVGEIDYAGLAVETMTSLKRFLKFKELGSVLGISIPTLWRYTHGDIRPGQDRAKSMLMRLLDRDIVNTVMSRILRVTDSDVINLYTVVYNIDVLTYASIDAFLWGMDKRFTAVATVEVDGIPLATMIAKRLGVKLVVVKRRKEVGFNKFIELSYITSMPPEVVTLYLPEGVIGHGDRVLVVDDLVRSGRTSGAICELIKKSGAKPAGFYALIGVGDAWKKTIMQYVGDDYRVLYEVRTPEPREH